MFVTSTKPLFLYAQSRNFTINTTQNETFICLVSLTYIYLHKKQTQNTMKITKSEGEQLGFTSFHDTVNGYGMDNENVRYEWDDLNKKTRVYVLSTIDDDSYHREVKGIDTIMDIISLCKLVNG